MNKNRLPFDFTDREVSEIYRALLLAVNERNTYWSSGRCKVFNNLIDKIDNNVSARKDKIRIMRNFYDIEELDNE